MKIDSGLFDHIVLQRSATGASAAAITGQTAAAGTVLARITGGNNVVPGFDRAPIGRAAEGKFSAQITGLPAGGPYRIELTIEGNGSESIVISDVCVGDVWILAGQSNMQGCGLIANAAAPHPSVRAFYMDDRWDVARDPLHNMWDCVDPIHVELTGGIRQTKNTDSGVGPGVAFGLEMQRYTNVPQGLIACAHGGTSMQQWDPGKPNEGGSTLYGALIRRFRKNGGSVAGVIWYQGESDATAEAAPQYAQRMRSFIASVRKDLNAPNLPVAIVQISRVVGWDASDPRHWNMIQEMQRTLPDAVDRCAVVPAIDLPMDDLIHIGGAGCNRLGKRLAGAMWSMVGGKTGAPIALKSITLESNPRTNLGRIIVEFANVQGELQTGGSRAVGFVLADSNSKPLSAHYHVDLEQNRAIVDLMIPAADASRAFLHYGLGHDPICNIVDADGRSLPVFGPHTLASTH